MKKTSRKVTASMVSDSIPPKISVTTVKLKLQNSKKKPEHRRSENPTLIKTRVKLPVKSSTSSPTKNGKRLPKKSQSSKSSDSMTLLLSLNSSMKRTSDLTSNPKKTSSSSP